jgi:GntR family transcriptional regulator/MocR family aminotransferase
VADRQSPTLDQAILTDFFVKATSRVIAAACGSCTPERQRLLLEAPKRELAGLVELRPDSAGLHLVGHSAGAAHHAIR